MEDSLVQATVSVSNTVDKVMNTFMVGNFFLNFFVSASMKKILTAIRVIQVIAFFKFILINYDPISLIFINSLYTFTTFKMVPPELMSKVLKALGMKKSKEEVNVIDNTPKRLLQ